MSVPMMIAAASGLLLLLMGAFSVFQVLAVDKKRKNSVSRRLLVEDQKVRKSENTEESDEETARDDQSNKAAEQALALASGGDTEKVARIRRMLVRSGDFDPASVARFALRRFTFLGVAIFGALILLFAFDISILTQRGLFILGFLGGFGYFLPSLILMKRIRERRAEYRKGFPDFMDLMIVCADAGLSLDASIDRVAKEIVSTYPYLAHNLTTFSLELRAGRTIHEAMKSFGDRVDLEEVDAFAVLLKQSKELGTSLASTLRVFSEEMRDKRMMMAEEKAHALPAKMTIPVTMCILPTVVMIAIIPVIVTLSAD
ncbi:MAG: type II secretion system F family protein [Pseudomonadota bacterium]